MGEQRTIVLGAKPANPEQRCQLCGGRQDVAHVTDDGGDYRAIGYFCKRCARGAMLLELARTVRG